MQARVEFPIARLRALSKTSNVRGALDLLLNWGGTALAVAWVSIDPEWYLCAAAVLFIATRQNSLANLAHDAWHGLCFAPRRLNDTLASWLYSYPIGIPFFHDRERHLLHHRRVGHRDDPDWVNYTNDGRHSRVRLVLFLVGRLFGSLLVEMAWSVLFQRRHRIALEMAETKAPSEFPRIVLCQVFLAGLLTLAVGWWGYLVLWLLPLATVTAFCNSLRAFVEHADPKDEVAPETRLFDVSAGPLERLLISPCHFNYHALHHAFPSIPHYRLPVAKDAVASANDGYPFAVVPGYLRVLGDHLRQLPPAGGPS